ncbi:MFS transporter [Rhodovulum sp. BSW8]|uniref:BCD family chlorophyll transporter-like MFS transporter n=1 Tax=Rhodovulum visakhapatnamense TaxID=364297 RepID=A0A4V3GTP5_9RHOB|nr:MULTISPECIES: PucC family protein [Rhodovulum]OLS44465.1 MFS transporter [Rhodovulum sulfidophilum]RBO53521.1 MFS transporter [Rhodovulum sp. BSW8]TDX27693.1 BCD family chlorophyll transporter-like MFS transporter [Rhodovulum visakhapatnamense]
MNRLSKMAVNRIATVGPRFLPFADAASEDLPLSRLLRLSMFQVSVGMAMVLLVGTLNRVMIVELEVPASIVGIMISLPLLFAPFRALIGFKSDTHRSALGWRRVPYIWKGTLLQWGGFAIMPFALIVLSGQESAAGAPEWIGILSAAISFLLVGAGVHTVQTVGLALATDLAPREDQPNVVGLMYVMLLVGMIVSALLFGMWLEDFYHAKLIKVIQGAAVATMVFNVIALWKMEARDRTRARPRPESEPEPSFREAWGLFTRGPNARRLLWVIGLGTLGFGLSDVLLEPFGGQVLDMSVAATTKLTASVAGGTLVGFAWASRVLSRGYDPMAMAGWGALVGLPAFAAITFSATLQSEPIFVLGTMLAGFGAGLFSHGTLTATMRSAPKAQVGLALGAWGAVQATSAGAGIALGGVFRDAVLHSPIGDMFGAATPYFFVYAIELALLVATIVVGYRLMLSRAFGIENAPD